MWLCQASAVYTYIHFQSLLPLYYLCLHNNYAQNKLTVMIIIQSRNQWWFLALVKLSIPIMIKWNQAFKRVCSKIHPFGGGGGGGGGGWGRGEGCSHVPLHSTWKIDVALSRLKGRTNWRNRHLIRESSWYSVKTERDDLLKNLEPAKMLDLCAVE